MTQDDRETPTEPTNLKPSDVAVSIPKLASLPADLVAAVAALPPPNPDSLIEMSISLFMRTLQNQGNLGEQLESAVSRINGEADKRSATRTLEITRNFELTNHEVQKLAAKVGDLEAIVRELPPRVGKIEERLDDGAERFEGISLELAAMRAQVAGLEQLYARIDRLEKEVDRLKEGQHHAAGTAETKTE
jgi:chromosome segregation ATPase